MRLAHHGACTAHFAATWAGSINCLIEKGKRSSPGRLVLFRLLRILVVVLTAAIAIYRATRTGRALCPSAARFLLLPLRLRRPVPVVRLVLRSGVTHEMNQDSASAQEHVFTMTDVVCMQHLATPPARRSFHTPRHQPPA